jgi:hypothetical protein
MLPWNYGFHWNAGTMIFMGAFYAVLLIVVATVLTALMRSRRALKANRAEQVRWQSDFNELPVRDRTCRHVFTCEFADRTCPNGFDCRACKVHASLSGNVHPAPPADDEEVLGMPFPADRLYHRGHTWVHREPDGSVTVGLDEFGRRVLGKLDSVALPEPGERVQVNGTAWRARKGNAEVRVLCPVDGEVLETGGPDRDFYLKVKPEGSFRHLLCPPEVKPWLLHEVERLQLALSAPGAAPTLADGGVLVPDLTTVYPEADWGAICGEMFMHP